MRYPNLILLFAILLFPYFSFSKSSLCEAAYNSNFEEIESIFKLKIKEIKKLRQFSNNHERLDSLEKWLVQNDCVKDALWNRNDCFTLITTTFHRSMGIILQTKDSVVELCFEIRTSKMLYGDYLFWKWGIDKTDNRMVYKKYQFCPGFIKRRRDTDSLNERGRIRDKHNYSVRFSMSIVNRNGGQDYGHGKPEGEALYTKITVSNISDTVKIIPWPKYQNHGLKMVYFELLDAKRKHLFTEGRNLNMARRETIAYDLLRLEPGEVKEFFHVINGECRNPEFRIECEHQMGLIKEGEYHLNAWYNPFGNDYPDYVWLPIEMDSMAIRSQDHFRAIRDGGYYAQIVNLGPNDRDNIVKRSQAIFDLQVLGQGGKYSCKIGELSYDGWGIIKNVELGPLQIGDTVAFSLRNIVDLENYKNLELNEIYKIHASWSNSNSFQIPANNLPFKEEGSIRNFQLVDFPNAIRKK